MQCISLSTQDKIHNLSAICIFERLTFDKVLVDRVAVRPGLSGSEVKDAVFSKVGGHKPRTGI